MEVLRAVYNDDDDAADDVRMCENLSLRSLILIQEQNQLRG